jgi:hypothetical protein
MQFNRTAVYSQSFSGIRSSSALLVSECNNSLFFNGKNGVFTSESERVSNDLYFLLIVYVHYFCIPALPLILNVLSRYEKNVRGVCDENMHIYSSENMSCMENKDYLSILSFLLKEQIKFNLIHRHQY